MKTLTYREFKIAAAAAAFVLLAAVMWPVAYAYADDASSTPASTVTTGDANSQADSENDVNTNTTTTEGDTTVSADNTADTTSDTAATADTGSNTASGDAAASITTGDAYASASSINVINTNIIDSAGLLAFSDLFSALGIDLRGLNLSYFTDGTTQTSTPSCSLSACGGNLTVTSNNSATTTSTVTVVANTGDNTASSTDGSAAISTGNAYASGNSVNLVNSNIIRSNYLLVGINNFGDLGGDVVLPNASFFEELLSHSSPAAHTDVSDDNTAVVTSDTAASADTGGNTASSTEGDARIATGDALASATSLNQVNTNLVGGSKIFFLFRIWGSWSGSVQGLPAGMTWAQTPDGLVITNGDGAPASLDELGGGSVDASTTNDASVASNVSVYALTGGNEARGDSTSISTGNAYASANSINVVNTNLIGTNWIYAIFNIFGNLAGNISFGHPDLWLGATAESGNPTLPGTPVTFHFTVSNRGDADATNVVLSADFIKDMLGFTTGSPTDSGESWNLGTIGAGQTQEFTYSAQTGAVPQGNSVGVPFTATVTSADTDGNPSDNTDNLTIVVTNPNDGTGDGPSFSSAPDLTVTKRASQTATTAPATIDYTVDITNNGGPAFNAVATDVLTDPTGAVVSTQSWDLDTINYHDEVEVTYSVVFAADSLPGNYTNTVTVSGSMHYPYGPGSVDFPPVSTSRNIILLGTSAPVCEQYLTGYIAPGADNDPEQVKKLQEFLRTLEAENGVTVNGVYDAATIAAVKRFQKKYASDILSPWGYAKPTGLVYYTTQVKINDIWCSGQRSFGLSVDQLGEITSTRDLISHLRAALPTTPPAVSTASTSAPAAPEEDIDLPPAVQVGVAPTAPPASGKGSWLGRILETQKSLMANVLGAFTSVVNVVAVR